MKIISFICNNNSCTLEVELEGEKIAIIFRKVIHYSPYTNVGPMLTGSYITKNTPLIIKDDEETQMNAAKKELSEYLSERLFREYDSLKKLKQ